MSIFVHNEQTNKQGSLPEGRQNRASRPPAGVLLDLSFPCDWVSCNCRLATQLNDLKLERGWENESASRRNYRELILFFNFSSCYINIDNLNVNRFLTEWGYFTFLESPTKDKLNFRDCFIEDVSGHAIFRSNLLRWTDWTVGIAWWLCVYYHTSQTMFIVWTHFHKKLISYHL